MLMLLFQRIHLCYICCEYECKNIPFLHLVVNGDGPRTRVKNWYPEMRLFRQKEIGQWASVVAELIDELTSNKV